MQERIENSLTLEDVLSNKKYSVNYVNATCIVCARRKFVGKREYAMANKKEL